MSRVSPDGTNYDVLRRICQQLNGLSEGRIANRYNAAASAPTTGSYQQGDFIPNSAPTEAGTGGWTYIVAGWICTVSGTPGTFEEFRVSTGAQNSIVGLTGTLAEFNTALTGADFATGGGTATGTNTGDQTSIVGITGNLAEFNAALTGADFATGGGTATGTNTGDQTSVTGNAGTATSLSGGAAGSTPYQTGASVTAMLAAGGANFKKFMNAAGTAPEWAAGVKMISSSINTANASASVGYTGVGFKPSSIIALAIINVTSEVCIGMGDATSRAVVTNYNAGSAGAWAYDTSLVYLVETAANTYIGDLASFDADGFTINWTKNGSPSGTALLFFLCFR
jgi:hypothetical protein